MLMQGMVEALGDDIYSYANHLRYTGGQGSDKVLVCNLQDGIYYVSAMKCLRVRREEERDPPDSIGKLYVKQGAPLELIYRCELSITVMMTCLVPAENCFLCITFVAHARFHSHQ